MVWVISVAVMYGDLNRVFYGVDSWGNICNQDNKKIDDAPLSGRDFRGVRRLFYFDSLSVLKSNVSGSDDKRAVCVAQCPDKLILTRSELELWSSENNVSLCRYDVPLENYTYDNSIDRCPQLPLLPHGVILNRCFVGVNLFFTIGESIFRSAINSTATAAEEHIPANCDVYGSLDTHLINDLMKTGLDIVYFGLFALAVSYFVVVLLSIKPVISLVVWGLVIGVAALGFLACFYLWWQWFFYKEALDTLAKNERIPEEEDLVRDWLYGAIAMTVVEVLILLIILYFCKRIRMAILLLHESGEALLALPFLTLQPFVTVTIFIVFVISQVYVLLLVISAGTAHVDEVTGEVTYKVDSQFEAARWLFILSILWCAQFVFACEVIFTAGAISEWYFTRERSKYRFCRQAPQAMGRAYWRVIRYHLGSAAFGALCIALIQFIRLLMFYYKKMFVNRQNKIAKKILECTECCLTCFQKFLEYVTKNAYIGVAITGDSLCKSGLRMLGFLISNAITAVIVNVISIILVLLSKLGIVVLVEVAAFYYFRERVDLCYIAVPLVIIAVMAFVIANAFLSVYSLAVDTLFLCMCVDLAENNGESKPYYMSKNLMKLMSLVNKEAKLIDKRAGEK